MTLDQVLEMTEEEIGLRIAYQSIQDDDRKKRQAESDRKAKRKR